ncbi:MAG: serine protease [Proteobacteria bacterium]|nr:serine protease [Pseudomonadota bacterium]
MRVLLGTGVVLAFLLNSGLALAEDRVIYGTDDRKDLFDPANDAALVTLAKSTAILVKDSELIRNPSFPNEIGLSTRTLKDVLGVCSTERFANQPSPGFCSGFLVGADTFVTAGHCIKSASDCAATAIVFDFGYDAEGKSLATVSKNSVYKCASVVSRELQSGRGRDYAVLKLDRPVEGREPVVVRKNGSASENDSIAVIGHPSGLPTKISDNAKVRSNSDKLPYLVANLDTYQGNSGSAVFNSLTGEVEGILVRGETDFDYDSAGSCRKSKVCLEDGCRGEDVTKSSVFASFLPTVD